MLPVERIVIAGFRGIPVPLEISFLEGRNPRSLILYGRNGTGKSSVTDGWEWLTSGKISHLAREGAEESSYPNMHAKPGETYVEVQFSDGTLGTVRLTFNPKGIRSPKVSGNLKGVRALVTHPCHIRHGDLTRFVLLTKAERFDALASLMGFVPQMAYLKALRRIAEKLNADLESQLTLYKDVEGRHNRHFTNLPGERLTPIQLLSRRFAEHEIAFDETPEALPTAAAGLKKLVVSDRNTKRLGVQRDAKTQLAGFRPVDGIPPKITALKAAVAELKASQATDREKLLRIPLLRSAKDVLEKLPPSGQCPLCRLTFSGDLKEHVGTELAALERLETLIDLLRLGKLIEQDGMLRPAAEIGPATLPPWILLKYVEAHRGGASDWHDGGGEFVLDPRFSSIGPGANHYGIRFRFCLQRPELTVHAGDMLVVQVKNENEPADVAQRGWALAWYGKRYDLWRRSWFEHPSRYFIAPAQENRDEQVLTLPVA